MTTKIENRRTDWAEEEDDDDNFALPAPQITKNKDGTETVVSYHLDDSGRKIKTTQRIKKSIVRTVVNPRVAERRNWDKFGLEKGSPRGPQSVTTSLAVNIALRLAPSIKANEQEEKASDEAKVQVKAPVTCRNCGSNHWTMNCPYKDSMDAESAPAPSFKDMMDEPSNGAGPDSGVVGANGSSNCYVPPHRKGAGGGGERLGNKFERDDLATLRVTNVSEFADEKDIRDMFSRYGQVTRVFLAKDRETGRAKGYAFVSFESRHAAATACEKMDGYGYGHLILRVELSRKSTT